MTHAEILRRAANILERRWSRRVIVGEMTRNGKKAGDITMLKSRPHWPSERDKTIDILRHTAHSIENGLEP